MSDINEFLLNKLDKLDEKLDGIRQEQLLSKAAFVVHEQRDQDMQTDVKAIGLILKGQTKSLDEYNQSLKEHMRRTELLEDHLKPIHAEFTNKQVLQKARLEKRKKILKIAGIISLVIGIGASIAQIVSVLK